MEPSALFESTKTAFSRLKAAGRGFNYPEGLRNDAASLLEHYSESALSTALGISRVSLRNWRRDKNQTMKVSPTFLTLDLDEDRLVMPKSPNDTIAFTVNLPHQLSLSLPEQSVKKAVQFICALMKEFER